MVFSDILDIILEIYSSLITMGTYVSEILTYDVAGLGSLGSVMFGGGILIYVVTAIAKWINPFE